MASRGASTCLGQLANRYALTLEPMVKTARFALQIGLFLLAQKAQSVIDLEALSPEAQNRAVRPNVINDQILRDTAALRQDQTVN